MISIWNLTNGLVRFILKNNVSDFDRIRLCALGNGGLASSSDDKTIKIWN